MYISENFQTKEQDKKCKIMMAFPNHTWKARTLQLPSGTHLNTLRPNCTKQTLISSTLRRLRAVSPRILAVIVHLMVPLHPRHGRVLLRAQPRVPARRARGRPAPRARRRLATADLEIPVPPHERLVIVVRLVLPVLRGPRRRVPDRAVHVHRPLRKRRVALPRVPSDRHVVHEKSAVNVAATVSRHVRRLNYKTL